jgi:hypothetical protein
LSAFGVTRNGQNNADHDDVGGTANGLSKRPTRTRKPTAKVQEALTSASSAQISKRTKRSVVISGDEDETHPQKKKNKSKVVVESDADTDVVSLNEDPPKKSKTRVFSRASEDSQDTHGNTTKASTSLGDLGNTSTGEANTSGVRGRGLDDEEWQYLELDEMATKDTQVSHIALPSSRSL